MAEKIFHLVESAPVKCFRSVVQCSVVARFQGDENPKSSVVTETLKLLENSSHGYQILDCSRHSNTM